MSTFKNVCRDATQFKIQSEKKEDPAKWNHP
jgi:hypothetical protein